MGRIKKAIQIRDEDVTVDENIDGLIVLDFPSSTSEYPNQVSFYDGLWMCTCEDYQYRKRKYGSFLCKHILKTIMYLYEHGCDLEDLIKEDET